VADAIRADGGRALAVKCDVLDRASIEAALSKTVAELGEVDALVNGAGGNQKQATTSDDLPFFDLPAVAMRFVFELNFTGTLLATQVIAKPMAARGNGVVLNISSMSALIPLTKIPGYSAAKAAVSNFTQWLAVHLCQNYSPDIRVNALAPGFFLTEQNRFLLTEEQSGALTPRGSRRTSSEPRAGC
jgi:NAD(P)-dependent dehydrogenase (short-subunit alcohol dehydrogenase family)